MARDSKKPSDVSTLFSSSFGTLAQIQEKTNCLKQLEDIVRHICPDLPQDAWHIANFHQNSLIIEVKSSVWGQRLQFERTKIAQALRDATQDLFNHIEIKVNPYQQKIVKKPETSPLSANVISPKAAKSITELAERAPLSLQKKLLKLAQHAKPSS